MYTIKLIRLVKHLQVRQEYFEKYLLGSSSTTGSHRMQKAHSELVRSNHKYIFEHLSGYQVHLIFSLLNNMCIPSQSLLRMNLILNGKQKQTHQRVTENQTGSDLKSTSNPSPHWIISEPCLTGGFLRWSSHSLSQVVLQFTCLCSHYIFPNFQHESSLLWLNLVISCFINGTWRKQFSPSFTLCKDCYVSH